MRRLETDPAASLVIVGLPYFLSITTLRPFGPSVTFTACVMMLTPDSGHVNGTADTRSTHAHIPVGRSATLGAIAIRPGTSSTCPRCRRRRRASHPVGPEDAVKALQELVDNFTYLGIFADALKTVVTARHVMGLRATEFLTAGSANVPPWQFVVADASAVLVAFR